MTISEMHDTFRVLGQQMGLQLVRGILPESIDVYINNVITEKVQQELLLGVRTALQDSVNTQASTMSTINTFRTLYRNVRYKITGFDDDFASDKTNQILRYYNGNNGYHIINIPTVNSEIGNERISPMMFLGFSVEYDNTLRGNPVACRLIGSDVLETTLRDYCNGASKTDPIVSLSSIPYVDGNLDSLTQSSNEQLEIFVNTKDCKVQYLNIKYIKTPNVVKFSLKDGECVHCDLPDYTHYDIVERAVQKFYVSVGAVTNQTKQQRQKND